MLCLRHVLLIALLALLGGTAEAKECKKGKKPCGGKCISAKKPCKEAPAAAAEGGAEGGGEAAPTLTCKKGKKPCGDQCIPAKKPCAEPGGDQPPPDPKLASASSAEVETALKSQAGQAMIQLARSLQKSGELDVDDRSRATFRQGLRGIKPPVPICSIGHVQLVRDCDAVIGGTVSLPCYLAVDEMAEVCKLINQPMPMVK